MRNLVLIHGSNAHRLRQSRLRPFVQTVWWLGGRVRSGGILGYCDFEATQTNTDSAICFALI